MIRKKEALETHYRLACQKMGGINVEGHFVKSKARKRQWEITRSFLRSHGDAWLIKKMIV